MTDTINTHITEYQKQIDQHRQAITALTGAIQALERLQEEDTDGDTTIRDQSSDGE